MKETVKAKLSNFKDGAVRKKDQAVIWVKEHKDDILEATPVILSGAVTVVGLYKSIKPTAGEKLDRKREKTLYDPHTGIRWDLRRKLTNDDRIEIVSRERSGESLDTILCDMRLIK